MPNFQNTSTNVRRIVAPASFILSGDDDYINVDTSAAGGVTIYLPNIKGSGFGVGARVFTIVDTANNASVSNITILPLGSDTINNGPSFVINTDGDSVVVNIVNRDQWSVQSTNAAPTGGGYNLIKDEGVSLPQRTTMNFIGAGVNVTDVAGETQVEILGGGGIIDTTYLDFFNEILAGTLVPETTYRILDYQSKNFANGVNIAMNNPPAQPGVGFDPREIYTSPNTEVLRVKAATTTTIYPTAFSESFPQDLITYNPLRNTIAVEDSNTSVGNLLWDGTNAYFLMPVGKPLLYGYGLYIQMTFSAGTQTFYCQYENIGVGQNAPLSSTGTKTSTVASALAGTKVVLTNLTNADFLAYDGGTLYVNYAISLGTMTGCIMNRIDTEAGVQVCNDWRNRKYRRFQINLTSIFAVFGTKYIGVGPDVFGLSTTGLSALFPTFTGTARGVVISPVQQLNGSNMERTGDNHVFGAQALDVVIGVGGYDNTWLLDAVMFHFGSDCHANVMVFNCGGNNFGNECNTNLLGNWQNNVLLHQCSSNKIQSGGGNNIGWSFNANTLLGFNNNVVGSYFSANTCQFNLEACSFDTYVIQNTFGGAVANSYFGNKVRINNFLGAVTGTRIESDFHDNVIGVNFDYNTVGAGCSNNTFGASNTGNSIGDFFVTNEIGDNFQGNTVGNSCHDNSFGVNCKNNVIGNLFYANTFGDDCIGNSFGYQCNTNTVADFFQDNIIGNFFMFNNAGDYMKGNTIGKGAQLNTFNDTFQDNKCGSDFSQNIFSGTGQATHNEFGDLYNNNTTGGVFINNKIGHNSNTNSFDDGCIGNVTGNDFSTNIFGTGMTGNVFGNGCFANTHTTGFVSNNLGHGYAGNSDISGSFTDNVIGDDCQLLATAFNFQYNNIGHLCNTNTFNGQALRNRIGSGFGTNTFAGACNDNIIGNLATGNVIGSLFTNNVIGNEFQNNVATDNMVNNQIGYACKTNSLGANFQNNFIQNNFHDNSITSDFQNNNVGNELNGCTFQASCQNNFWDGLQGAIDYSPATHVYQPYRCRIFMDLSSGFILEYYTGGVIQYVSPTA